MGVGALRSSAGRDSLTLVALFVGASGKGSLLASGDLSFLELAVVAFPTESVVLVARSGGFASVRAIWEEMMAGSTGAPATVGFPEGGLRAGGMYLLA